MEPDAIRNPARRDWRNWRWQLRHSRPAPRTLERLAGIAPRDRRRWRALLRRYPCRITPYYGALVRWDDPADPLRRQCLPDLAELDTPAPGGADPLGEHAHLVAPGLVQRYPDRALALTTGDCALFCRHCTRKNLWQYGRPAPTRGFLRRLAAAVARRPAVREVIVSGGDPLLLDDDRLDAFLAALRAIPHVEVLRIGTRAPAVLPMRITPALCARLARHRPLWINTQFNHPRELTPEAAEACGRLVRAGLPVSNQAVLLRGVNDDLDTLKALCNGLQRLSVRPYYLFQCDAVRGAGHFSTPWRRGIELAERLRAELGGLSAPLFVADLPGGGGKVPLLRSPILSLSEHRAVLRGHDGRRRTLTRP